MKQIFVKPNGDAKVINPVTNDYIATDGEYVLAVPYFLRRIATGELVVAPEPKKPRNDRNKEDK